MQSVFLADAQPAVLEHIRDLADGAGIVIAQIADDNVRFVDEHAGADFESLGFKARIDVGIIIVSADRDMGDVLFRKAEEGADAVGR